jgi:LysR family transcriptional activator of glutamate synthase operon
MDFQQLRIFRAAAESAGFTRASEVLELSQSTVSQHIKQLEDDLGCSLFLRAGKKVYLTEAGKLLRVYADRIFNELKSAERSVRELSEVKRGKIRLGVGATTLTYRLPPILAEYKRRYPEIELIVITGATELLLHSVSVQHLDLAITMEGVRKAPGNLTMTPLGAEELVVIINAEHPLAKRTTLDPIDLLALPLILFENHTAMQNVIDSYLNEMGIEPKISMELENIEAIKSLVAAGLGASIVPVCTVNKMEANSMIRVLRVRGHIMERRLALATLNSEILPAAIEKLSGQVIRFLATPTLRAKS